MDSQPPTAPPKIFGFKTSLPPTHPKLKNGGGGNNAPPLENCPDTHMQLTIHWLLNRDLSAFWDSFILPS
jgi:hypothetical protein